MVVPKLVVSSVLTTMVALPWSCSGFLQTIPSTHTAPATTISTTPTTTMTTLWMAYPPPERVKTAGGGIPVVPSGDRLLFDPSMEGMLGGTESLNRRLQSGSDCDFLPAVAATSQQPPAGVKVVDAQAWLEDIDENGTVPPPFAKASSPVTATILGRAKIISDDAPGDIQHVLLKLPEGFRYVEGQSLSVIPPGIDPKTGRNHKPRLYSIASTRYGDLVDGTTVSLCVRRAEYIDPITGTKDPSKQGVCSNFLCDALPGQTVSVAGPVGKTMTLPQDPSTDIIMVATGTGIAPYRAFLHRLFMEETPARHLFTGKAWLILGVPVTGGLLYPDEFSAMQQNAKLPGQLELTYAISREATNQKGGKLYVQDVLAEQADKLFERLENGANIYFCGLKGMMPGILEALEQVATSRGMSWSQKLKEYKANHQWHVEVY